QQLIAQLDFWSLISMSPRVNTFVLDGLDANLPVDKQGNGNWTRIMKEDAAATGTPSDGSAQAGDTAPTPAAAAEEGGAEPLNFNVENVQISNARVHYDDQATGQSVTLDNFAVNARDITLGQAFPLDLSFRVETNQPRFAVDAAISAELGANEAL